MGIAAYNRGSRALIASLDAAMSSPIVQLAGDLNVMRCAPGACVPFDTDEVLTLSRGHGGWWLSCNITGFGYWDKTPWKLMRRFAVRIVGINEATGEFLCRVDASRKLKVRDKS